MKKNILITGVLLFLSSAAFSQSAAPVPLSTEKAKTVTSTVPQSINLGMSEYNKKNYGKASKALNAAILELRNLKSEKISKFLPPAPKGWAVKGNKKIGWVMNLGRGSKAAQSYESGGEVITLQIDTDNKLMSAMRKFSKKSSASTQQFLGYDYVFQKANPKKSYQKNNAKLYISKELTISVSGSKLTSLQAQGFIGLVDLKKLKVEAER